MHASNLSLPILNQQLLLLYQPLCNTKRDLKRVSNNISRREREPLRQRDVLDAVTLVDLDPHQVLRVGRVLDVVACQHNTQFSVSHLSIYLGNSRLAGGERGGGWSAARASGSQWETRNPRPGIEIPPTYRCCRGTRPCRPRGSRTCAPPRCL